MPSVGLLLFETSGLCSSTAAGFLFPGDHAPHVAAAFGDADIGDAICHCQSPVGIRRQCGGRTHRGEYTKNYKCAHDVSRAVQHGVTYVQMDDPKDGKTPH